MKKRIAILGSTGSIGVQALDVVSHHQDLFEVEVLTAKSNADLLIEQALRFRPNTVVIVDEMYYNYVNEILEKEDIKVFAGRQSLLDVVSMSTIDMVLVALVGFSGLEPTYKAIQAGKSIALANKETLVAGGAMIMPLATQNAVPILPVDSEHSAIFQCLVGEHFNVLDTIILTASGGPFYGKKRAELQNVTVEQALSHPNWSMGNKVTIDSATMMNKGLEMIEACWLFNVKPSQVNIVVHPQSIVHSMVCFSDGSIKAQLALPDMRLPIQYAMAYPHRLATSYPRFSFADYSQLGFYEVDRDTFSCLNIAYTAMNQGGNIPCAMNACNEIAVEAFLNKRIQFLDIATIVESALSKIDFVSEVNIENCYQTDALARRVTTELIENL